MLKSLGDRLCALRWPRVIALALALAAVPTALAWQHFQVERDYHALWMLLHRARTQAMRAGPMTVRFTDHRAGDVLQSLFLATLHEVRDDPGRWAHRVRLRRRANQSLQRSPARRRRDLAGLDWPGTLAVGSLHGRDHQRAE
jgi:hypothetical protein